MPGAAEQVLPVFEFAVGVVEASASKRGDDAGGG
jgi:hypothetical protein